MLVLTRKPKEKVVLKTADGDIIVTYIENRGGNIRLGFTAPKSVVIRRDDLKSVDYRSRVEPEKLQ